MVKKDIIYNNLLRLLEIVTLEGINFQQYHDALPDSDSKEKLIKASEDIDTEFRAIRASKVQNRVHPEFDNLLVLLEGFEMVYPDFPGMRLKEIFILIKLLSKLIESVDEEINMQEEVATEIFSFVELSRPVFENYFVFYDPENLENSILLLNIGDVDSVSEFLQQKALATELYFQIISKVGCNDVPLEPSKHVLIKADLKEKKAAVWACLAMHLVKEGLLVHRPHAYTAKPGISGLRIVESGKEYQQFNDTLFILSEYNYESDILNKYLRIYHIIENFMYKFPLVKLEREHRGAVFSMRDFQRIFDKISSSEITSLTNLITRICQEDYAPGTKFSRFILNKWMELHPTKIPDKARVDSLLKRMRITKKLKNELKDLEFGYLNTENINKYASLIFYSFRNSLVHNRETEFHLTHETFLNHPDIGNTAKVLLEEFLIPVLEEIVFFLITKENEIVWFENPSLTLFYRD